MCACACVIILLWLANYLSFGPGKGSTVKQPSAQVKVVGLHMQTTL